MVWRIDFYCFLFHLFKQSRAVAFSRLPLWGNSFLRFVLVGLNLISYFFESILGCLEFLINISLGFSIWNFWSFNFRYFLWKITLIHFLSAHNYTSIILILINFSWTQNSRCFCTFNSFSLRFKNLLSFANLPIKSFANLINVPIFRVDLQICQLTVTT